MNKKTLLFSLFILGLFIFRVLYGLCSEFWFDDELQIYLIGLKSFTTQTWPFLGPDIVYTNTQIPGALQGLLVGLPFFLVPVPEAPTVFLNVLSFASLAYFAWYLCKRFTFLPAWVVWAWVMVAPWTINYGTRVVNPSYVLIFSIPFFISFFETFENNNRLVGKRLSLFVMGAATTLIMQLHMSWVLLVPFAAVSLFFMFREQKIDTIKVFPFHIIGLIAGLSTLIPTFLQDTVQTPSVGANVVFNFDNLKNIGIILMRFFSFASYELPYWMGPHTVDRLAVVKYQPWMTPFVVFLLAVGYLQVALFVVAFFKKDKTQGWQRVKWVTLGSVLMIYTSFFFSIKGPSSHTFYIMLPMALFYSFHCYQWLFAKKKIWLTLFKLAVVSGFFFSAGLGLYNLKHKSLYKNRQKAQQAIEKRDYKILGNRRSDEWGYGY